MVLSFSMHIMSVRNDLKKILIICKLFFARSCLLDIVTFAATQAVVVMVTIITVAVRTATPAVVRMVAVDRTAEAHTVVDRVETTATRPKKRCTTKFSW